jgi:membrane protein insertase Oxa1/YidC/SpoIIIJ
MVGGLLGIGAVILSYGIALFALYFVIRLAVNHGNKDVVAQLQALTDAQQTMNEVAEKQLAELKRIERMQRTG